jgi:hypothetical protein
VDRTYQDSVDPGVRDFLEAMKATAAGTGKFDAAICMLFTYKVSLHMSLADPSVPNAVRNEFVKWLRELSKFPVLKGVLSTLRKMTMSSSNVASAYLTVPGGPLYIAKYPSQSSTIR